MAVKVIGSSPINSYNQDAIISNKFPEIKTEMQYLAYLEAAHILMDAELDDDLTALDEICKTIEKYEKEHYPIL